MLSEESLAIWVCPVCKTKVQLLADKWFVCQNPECNRKYPIRNGIPRMLKEEGDKYIQVSVEHLVDMEP